MAIIRFGREYRDGLKFAAIFIDNKLLPFDEGDVGRADLERGRVYNIVWRIEGPLGASLVVHHLGHGGVIVDSAIREKDLDTPGVPDEGRRSTFSFFTA